MDALRIGLQVLLAGVFLAAGLAKITRQRPLVDNFRRMRLSTNIMVAAGATEVLAGAGLLVGLGNAILTVVVASALVVQMLMAAVAETRGGQASKVLPPLVLAGLAAGVGALALTT